MIILPAIDLMSGEVVRLEQGKADRKTIYSDDPVAFAKKWEEEGAEWLHLVDLDAAFSGESKNLEIVSEVTKAIEIPCELGGGIRSLRAIEKALEAGVERCIIGSMACQTPEFVEEAAEKFDSSAIAVGIDAKDGQVAIKGWVEESEWDAYDLARAVADYGAGTIIYTDISTDGMGTGPNLDAQQEMMEVLPKSVDLIASGGIGELEHLQSLAEVDGLYGAIVGKALYDGNLTLKECLSTTR
ncbi:MAG: 1-(5-phosphoribosyl)-5-[(5-phosphoribosylamino)methylideneamino]imidazole-4-carboxamide isomerase [Verrucomicrobiota bacterium]